MANQKISELNSIALSGLVDSDVFTLVDTSAQETKKIEWLTLKVPTLIGCKISNSVNSTGIDLTSATNFSPDTEVYDIGGWHSGANADRLIVPAVHSGMYADVLFHSQIFNGTTDEWATALLERYNAADVLQQIWGDQQENGLTWRGLTVTALGVPLVGGEYFSVKLQVEADMAVDISTRTEFSIRLVGQ